MIQTIQYQDCIALERFTAANVTQYEVELPSFHEPRELTVTICLTPDRQVQSLLFPLDTLDQDLLEFARLRWLTVPSTHYRRRVSPVFDVIADCGDVDVVLCYPGPRVAPWREQELGQTPWVRPTTWDQFEHFRSVNPTSNISLIGYGVTDWFARFPTATDNSFLNLLRQVEEYATVAHFYRMGVQRHRADPACVLPLLRKNHLTRDDDWSAIAAELPLLTTHWLESIPLPGPRLMTEDATHLTITNHALWPHLSRSLVSLMAYSTAHGRLVQLDALWWIQDSDGDFPLDAMPSPPDHIQDIILIEPEEALYPIVVQNRRLISPIEPSFPELL